MRTPSAPLGVEGLEDDPLRARWDVHVLQRCSCAGSTELHTRKDVHGECSTAGSRVIRHAGGCAHLLCWCYQAQWQQGPALPPEHMPQVLPCNRGRTAPAPACSAASAPVRTLRSRLSTPAPLSLASCAMHLRSRGVALPQAVTGTPRAAARLQEVAGKVHVRAGVHGQPVQLRLVAYVAPRLRLAQRAKVSQARRLSKLDGAGVQAQRDVNDRWLSLRMQEVNCIGGIKCLSQRVHRVSRLCLCTQQHTYNTCCQLLALASRAPAALTKSKMCLHPLLRCAGAAVLTGLLAAETTGALDELCFRTLSPWPG